ncbi:MAG: aminoglycoside resistance protein [Nocardioides sp.]|nr:aminoglycoside resistance protein [Nocardioides sp.]
MATRGDDWAAYVDRVPRLLRELVEEWSLRPEGPVWWGHASVVLPVVDDDGSEVVLKVAFPDVETEHEALALRTWSGRGAVTLLRADPHRRAVLLERLERRDLTEEWDLAACETVARLYGDLHVPAPARVRTVASYVGSYVERMRALPVDGPLPHRMVEQWLAHVRDLVADKAGVTGGRLVHGDLHYENVLADPRAPGEWRVIDPHAMNGDPTWELAPMLWNRFEETAGDVHRSLRTRFETLVDTAGLDEDRARAWVHVRLLLNALWEVEEADAGRPVDRDYVTRMITVAKAVVG